MAFKNRHSVEATRTTAERLVTDHVLDAGKDAALSPHAAPRKATDEWLSVEGPFKWPYAVFAFHDCMEHPSLPCPACLSVEHEESLKKQG
jgi:hypothetical protein